MGKGKVNYVVGEGIYMLPSDMDLHVGGYVQYNQNNFVSDSNMNIGKNKDQNSTNLYTACKSTNSGKFTYIDHDLLHLKKQRLQVGW